MFAEWRVVTAHFSWIGVYLLLCSQFYSADIFGQWLKNENSFLKEKEMDIVGVIILLHLP